MSFLVFFLLSLALIGAFALFAVGLVLIYQASRLLNLAHGAMGTLSAYVAYSASKAGVPMLLVLPLAALVGAATGVAIERVFVRTLRAQGPTAQTVGTVAAFGVITALVGKVWGTAALRAPTVFPDGGVHVSTSLLSWGQLGIFAASVAAAAGVYALFQYTRLGLAMRAAAENRRAASLMGIDSDRTTMIAWAIAGALAGVTGVMLAAVTNLHPYTLSLQMLPAFVAALIGGMTSLVGAVLGAVAVGAALGMVPAFGGIPVIGDFASQIGASQVVLALIAFGVMVRRGEPLVAGDPRGAGL
ncbi:MAG: branched-chain amino acid ABC transporter permease [Actinomycetota bacterium]|nr:branched-chain amino acid ABC transporter permease [Actinomycetota bacterium]